jgi:hypothetical protein
VNNDRDEVELREYEQFKRDVLRWKSKKRGGLSEEELLKRLKGLISKKNKYALQGQAEAKLYTGPKSSDYGATIHQLAEVYDFHHDLQRLITNTDMDSEQQTYE